MADLSHLRDRLAVARDLLTESGSCFVQIGDENVHLVRSLMDEVFGPDLLEKTGTGNLFTVLGEPDIDVRQDDAGVVVELRGVDVYDPTTGEVGSDGTDRIALWMIDTDYDEESFYVRH